MNTKLSAWVAWALLEGLARTASITTVALVGLSFTTPTSALLATLVIGLVQMLGALTLARRYDTRLWLGREFFAWSLAFAVFAVAGTLLGFLVLGSLGGDIATYVFIAVGLSIIPGVFIDRVFFSVRLSRAGWLGVGIAVVGGYVMLGFPSLAAIAGLPLWVLLSLLGACVYAANRGVTRFLVRTENGAGSTYVQNLYVGAASVLICAGLLPVFSSGAAFSVIGSGLFWVGSIAIGMFVLVLVSANFMAFERGADIAVKETLSIGTFLFLSAIAGALFLADPFAWNKLAGIGLYLIAFSLLQKGRW